MGIATGSMGMKTSILDLNSIQKQEYLLSLNESDDQSIPSDMNPMQKTRKVESDYQLQRFNRMLSPGMSNSW